jgi:WD40 repeat protein
MPGLIAEDDEALPFVAPSATAQLQDGPLDVVVGQRQGPLGRVAVVCAGGPVVCFDGPALGHVTTLDDHRGGACAAAYSQDGSRLLTGGQDGAWVLRGDATHRSDDDRIWVEHVAFSRDGARFAFTRGRQVHVHDATTCARIVTHTAPSTPTALRAFDGVLVAACYGGLQVWSQHGTGQLRQYPWKSPLLSLEQSPDARFYAAGCHDGAVHCWRRSSGEDFQMSGYPTKVKALAFSPDSRFLATGGSAVVTVWDFSGAGPEGTRPLELVGHVNIVSALTFAGPRRLWSGDADGAVIGWQLGRAGPAPTALHVHRAPVVTLTCIDHHVLAIHSDGAVFALPA